MSRRISLLLITTGIALAAINCSGQQRAAQTPEETLAMDDAEQTEVLEKALVRNLETSEVTDCPEAARLRDQICALSDRICGITEKQKARPELCTDSRDRCSRARTKVKERCGSQ